MTGHRLPWGRLVALFIAGLVISGLAPAPAPAEEPALPDRWVFAYVMSYDNDLSALGPPILDALERGTKDTSIVVTVLHDDRDARGLKRHVFTREARTAETLPTDDSASEEVLSSHLDWVGSTYPATHYVVVFLDHGGGLDEMCADTDAGANRRTRWLSVRGVARVLEAWRRKLRGQVDLVFLQQCGRGSLENLWCLRGAADYLLASQADVGTPNTYYEKTLAWLVREKAPTGRSLARTIMAEDEDYLDYACVEARALEDLPARLEPVVATLRAKGSPAPRPSGIEPCYARSGDAFFDVRSWLRAAAQATGHDPAVLVSFERWLTGSLIVEHASRGERAKDWCGLSLLVPDDDNRETYVDFPLYAASTLDDLWRTASPGER